MDNALTSLSAQTPPRIRIGTALPSAIPGTHRRELLGFATRADRLGLASLGTDDRLVYDAYEPLAALAAAAAVTERIRLMSTVLIGPLQANVAKLAQQAASVNAIAEGRLTLGFGLGGREDDYAASGIGWRGRGAALDDLLVELRKIWATGEIGPMASTPPRLLIGGHVEASFARAARHGDGWIAGGADPDSVAAMAGSVLEAWSADGRAGRPEIVALTYFSLGPRAGQRARDYLLPYYSWLGPAAEQVAASAALSAATLRDYVDAYAGAGCTEILFFPCSAEPKQVELLAAALDL